MGGIRVALFPSDDTGCGTFRIRLPAAVAGNDIEPVFPPGTRGVLEQIASGLLPVDVAVFQRPAHRVIADLIPAMQRHGVAVVVELDDDLAALPPGSGMFEALHPVRYPRVNWQHVKRAVALADLVTVTTPVLAGRYGGPKAVVLPNLVPESRLEIRAERDGRTIGWGGTTETHVGDLAVTRGGVAKAVRETGARFLQVGPPDGVRHDLGLDVEPDTTDGLPFDEYHQALAQLDVAIAPLADSLFNRGKSGLKVLEAAALGSACVASPRPEYEGLASEGLCVVARDRGRDWFRECRRLLADEGARRDLADRARQAVRDRHTYEGQGWRWAEAWAEALVRRRRTPLRVAA